jgi:hypothetical protein
VRVGRNLKAFPLPAAMSREDRCAMEEQLAAAFNTLIAAEEYGGKYVSITPGHPREISAEEYEALVTAHIMFKDMSADSFLTSAGIASDWPCVHTTRSQGPACCHARPSLSAAGACTLPQPFLSGGLAQVRAWLLHLGGPWFRHLGG